jgi:protein SCO1/2
MSKTHSERSWPAKLALALSLALLGLGIVAYISQPPDSASTDNTSQSALKARLATPRPLTDFQLTTHDQKTFDLNRLKDKWTLLFFGYTHCPDVCPTTLTELAQTIKQLEPAVLKDTQFVFVSVDPARDTPESLAEYVNYFDARFLSATGSVKALRSLTQQLDVKFSLKTDPAGEPIVNHSSTILLIDPQVRYYARFKAPHYAEQISAQYLAIRDDYQHNLSIDKPIAK